MAGKKFIPAIAVVALIIGGIAFYSAQTTKNCVNLVIDYGVLDPNSEPYEKCLATDNEITALELMKSANFKLEGTDKYGDAVVCRVNGLPDKSVEPCETMPPEKAFWAVIVKKKPLIPFTAEWGWAQKGINETFVSPGDSLGLVFSTNGDLKWP